MEENHKYVSCPDMLIDSDEALWICGYTKDDMFLMGPDVAQDLLEDPDCPTIYVLGQNDSKYAIDSVTEDDGYTLVSLCFGVKKKDWSDYQMKDTDWLDTPRGRIKILPGSSLSLRELDYSEWFNYGNYTIMIDVDGKHAYAVDRWHDVTMKHNQVREKLLKQKHDVPIKHKTR